MGTQKAKRHVHKYRVVPMGSSTVWACGKSDCNHYMPPNMAYMIEGKNSECWECGNTLILSVDRMEYAITKNEGRAICDRCKNLREGNVDIQIDDLTDIKDILAKMNISK